MSLFRWAAVTASNPLRIQLDGDPAPLALTPDSLVDPLSLSVGDRVRVEIARKKVVVHGSGTTASAPIPSGNMNWTARASAPAGWLLCDGSTVSRTTYAALFAALNALIGTVTVTIATPAVVTKTAHGLQTGQMLYLTTTGALPTGLAANTGYFAIRIDANTLNLASSLANALAGTKIATTGSQSGVHTLRTTWGVGNGSTTFNVPNLKGAAPVGADSGQTEFAAPGITGGSKSQSVAAHRHDFAIGLNDNNFGAKGTNAGMDTTAAARGGAFRYSTSAFTGSAADGSGYTATRDSSSSSASGALQRYKSIGDTDVASPAVTVLQPYVALNAIIKT